MAILDEVNYVKMYHLFKIIRYNALNNLNKKISCLNLNLNYKQYYVLTKRVFMN